jgi:thiol-disulfide isomerase/thioredoxin
MLDRIVVAMVLMIAGIVAYRMLLLAQRRLASRQAQSSGGAGRAALLVFTSPTCAPCKLQQLPIINRLIVEWSDKIDARVIDVTEQPDVAQQYGVWSLPTTIVLKADRNVVAINQGVANEKKLREQFERATTGQAVTRQLVTGQSVTG